MEENKYRKYYLSDKGSQGLVADLTQDLRAIEDMKEEEAIEMARLFASPTSFYNVTVKRIKNNLVVYWGDEDSFFNATGELFYTPEQFHYLLTQRFDIFGINNIK